MQKREFNKDCLNGSKENFAAWNGLCSYPMNFQLNTSFTITIICIHVDLVKSFRYMIRIECRLILVRQGTGVLRVRREDTLYGGRLGTLESGGFWVDDARRVAGREGEERRVARIDDVLLCAKGGTRARDVPLTQANETAFVVVVIRLCCDIIR